jgi:DNA-binding transcriptional LysR family regulator
MDRFASVLAFVRVVESQGFTAAARRMNLSTTTVSGQVQALEDSLGVRLLNRTTRRVNVTDIGREYYERCSRIVHELDEADELTSAVQRAPRGQLRVYCPSGLVTAIAPVVAAYLRDNADVSVDLRTGDRMIDLLEEGFDLAIRAFMPPDSSLVARRLVGWRHVACCAPSYLKEHPALRTPADLASHNCFQYAFYPFGDEWHFVDPAGKTIVARVKGDLVTTSHEVLRECTLVGHGLWHAPSFMVDAELKARSLVPLLPDYPGVEHSIVAVYPHRRHLATKVRVFIDALATLSASQQWCPRTVKPGSQS